MTSKKNEAVVRQTKGSVQEAIGKIIGDVAVEKQGSRESKAGAKQADAETPIDPNDKT
ncbi:hypothetical protein [Sphingomonas sp. Leaf242]|uniref:hypothetical protein n=1 Tax=Sphingomonas sp. Leaf242 TaxID=1736304 RepID=UPI000ABBB6B9|nr:hypothetical protein [Sphingomonas sp. Leaf242]